MNIVYDGSTLKPVKQEVGHAYALDELVFFVPKKYAGHKIFLILNSGKKFDAVELKQVNSTSKDYYNFVCATNSTVKITSGACRFSLMSFAEGEVKPDIITSDVTLSFDNTSYNFKAQISLIEQFSKASAEMYKSMTTLYDSMVKLSKLNIEALSESDKNGGGGE